MCVSWAIILSFHKTLLRWCCFGLCQCKRCSEPPRMQADLVFQKQGLVVSASAWQVCLVSGFSWQRPWKSGNSTCAPRQVEASGGTEGLWGLSWKVSDGLCGLIFLSAKYAKGKACFPSVLVMKINVEIWQARVLVQTLHLIKYVFELQSQPQFPQL